VSTRLVIDTSVAFKWFVAYGESGLDEAWELLNRHRRGETNLVAPDLARAEIANVLRFSGTPEEDALALLAEYERAHVVHFPATPQRVENALGCAFTNRISVYDAMFLSLAQELNCALATADRRAFGSIPPSVAEVQLIL
jgi:predicted nucleic acid-binding protein